MADLSLLDVPHDHPEREQRSGASSPPRRRRARRGVGTYVLRVIVTVYLFFLVAWPVSLVAQR